MQTKHPEGTLVHQETITVPREELTCDAWRMLTSKEAIDGAVKTANQLLQKENGEQKAERFCFDWAQQRMRFKPSLSKQIYANSDKNFQNYPEVLKAFVKHLFGDRLERVKKFVPEETEEDEDDEEEEDSEEQ